MAVEGHEETDVRTKGSGKLKAKYYESELATLQNELAKLQRWIAEAGAPGRRPVRRA